MFELLLDHYFLIANRAKRMHDYADDNQIVKSKTKYLFNTFSKSQI